MSYLFLLGSILCEVFASTMLKFSKGFSNKKAVLGLIIGYLSCFYLLSLALLELPLGFSYAIWSALGTVLTALAGLLLFKEKINKQGLLGIVIILLGTVILNLAK